ncbi:hypothetical protein [Campylobacter concisus]|uniref:hypothetical protein n=1 Tax=Campylobacter concisus TaxID=199 RepID=UPI000CD86B78|nr:hypothetical protein [Campylobacter concisus]
MKFDLFGLNLTFCSEKFWRNFEMNLLYFDRALKWQMSCSQILIKARYLACEINFKIKLDA